MVTSKKDERGNGKGRQSIGDAESGDDFYFNQSVRAGAGDHDTVTREGSLTVVLPDVRVPMSDVM